MGSRLLAASAAAAILLGAPVSVVAADLPATWDGLVHVDSTKLKAVYLMPGVDFRPYTKVLLDPTEVAFEKNWIRDYNNAQATPDLQISQSEAKRILNEVQSGFEDIFQKAYAAAGFEIATEPGPDVIRVRTAVVNLRVSAPDLMTAGRVTSFAQDAGGASMILEARDSMSNTLLGRAVDTRTAGDTLPYRRNSVSNRSDFARIFQDWAKTSANGLTELKARSPIAAPAQTAGR
jgi:hypothetical protein